MRKKVLSAALSIMMIATSVNLAFGAEFSSGEEIETISEENKKADQKVNFSEQSGNKSSEDVFDFEAENLAGNESEELSISEEAGGDENLVSSPEKLTDVFQSDGLYMEEKYKAALENAPVSDVEDAAQIDWNISDGIESALGREGKVVDKGKCGDEVYWELLDDGTLIIHGYGKMYDNNYNYNYNDGYGYYDDSPFLNGKAVVISDGVTNIGEGAFYDCSSLSSVTIPSSVTSIGDDAFCGCSSLRSVTIPSSVTWIGNSAFSGCSSLSSVTIPNSVTSIGAGAFWSCSSLSSVTIPGSVAWIAESAFVGCSSLSSVTIPNSVTSIGEAAFCGCSSLRSVTIPGSVTSIGEYAFADCSSLSSVTISSGMWGIGFRAFGGCSSLSSVTIPSSVTRIDDGAFDGCSSKLVIYGHAGSRAESYAKENNIKFQILGHTHTYGKYTVTKKPTCTESGTKKKVCTTCSAEVTESIPATGHTWNSGKITKAATASATGIKTYTCTVCKATKTEIIPKKTLVNNTITASNITRTYSAKAQTFYLNVKRKGSGKITYSSNDKSITVNSAGKVTVKAKYVGKATITIKVAEDGTYKAAAKKITITVNKLANVITASNITRTYSAKAQTFSIGAKRKGTGKLTYSSNNSKVAVNSSGKITVKAKFIGKATITIKAAASSAYKAAVKKITVTVNPTKTVLSGVSNVKGKKITVKWKKNTVGTGYQIQYSKSKTFASGNKTVNVAKNSAASKTITGLSKGKTYYVRIRTYKTVSGTTYYSGWSGAKSVKINK